MQRVVEKVAQDPMHAHTADNTSNISVKNESSTNSTFDLTRSMGGSGSQFTGMVKQYYLTAAKDDAGPQQAKPVWWLGSD